MNTPNPFSKLYLSEASLESTEFASLYSDVLVESAEAIYSRGNVVVRGDQGSGKSMLLSLLYPRVLNAFNKASRPVPETIQAAQSFITCSVNLSNSGILDIAQRNSRDTDPEYLCSMFEDFFNTCALNSLFDNLDFIKNNTFNRSFYYDKLNFNRLDNFAEVLAQDGVFRGYTKNGTGFYNLWRLIKNRITAYFDFFQFNVDKLDEDIGSTKTQIGKPLYSAYKAINESGLAIKVTELFVSVDQYEALEYLAPHNQEVKQLCREAIHKAMSYRLPGVSYKIGTRQNGWPRIAIVKGSSAKLENERDFKIVDLGMILRREEDSSSYIFPRFASDVINRRAELFLKTNEKIDFLKSMLGKGYTDEELISKYVSRSLNPSIFSFDKDYPESWRSFIMRIAKEQEILSAFYAHAWSMQQTKNGKRNFMTALLPDYHLLRKFWNRAYWKKERKNQALLQISARTAQRLLWSGKEGIINLSGTNVLILLSICQHIWDARSRNCAKYSTEYNPIETVDYGIQSTSVYNASKLWFEKIKERPDGDFRLNFVNNAVRFLRKLLCDDKSMSYPGAVGFSLQNVKTDQIITISGRDVTIQRFLEECEDYEILCIRDHTSKNSNKTKQKKVYFNSIFCPYLQIPSTHPKEPYYVSHETFLSWLHIGPTSTRHAAREENLLEANNGPILKQLTFQL